MYIQELNSIDSQENLSADIEAMVQAIERFKSGELSPDDFKKFRLHRGIYGQRQHQEDFYMVRVKVPQGILTANQLRRLSEVAERFADGVGHITTRQDIQFHWVQLENIPEVMHQLAEVGLTTREACGNTVRNIVSSPLAGVSPDEAFDVTPYARLLSKHLLRNPLNQQLPRKFKISFSGSENDGGIIPWIHDIGFVARFHPESLERDSLRGGNGISKRSPTELTARGFKVYVGGGLGAQPRVADVLEEFIPEELFVPTAEAILKIFDRLGNRKNRNKARMKYIIWNTGIEKFRALVRKEREEILREHPEPILPETTSEGPPHREFRSEGSPDFHRDAVSPCGIETDSEFALWRATNLLPQKQGGFHMVYVSPTIGDLTTEQLQALAEIAGTFSDGTVRTTTQQDVVIRWIRTAHLPEVYRALRQANLHHPNAETIADVTSCPGADTCNLGITHSRALGKELAALLSVDGALATQGTSQWPFALKDIRIKISGCQNSCGQHHVAAIGFYGSTVQIDGHTVPHYVLMLGGGLNSGKAVFARPLMKIPARRVPEAVSRIIGLFLNERKADENFWVFLERVGLQRFKDELRDLQELKPYTAASKDYLDLGQTVEFKVQTGKGECAT